MEAVRGLAQELGSHATLLVYPGLGHDIFAAPQVRQELRGFIAEYRSSDRDRRHA
jgi:hypothetical protein